MSTKEERTYQRIVTHGRTIAGFFGIDEEPAKLCRKLRALEVKANKVMVDFCNGDTTDDKVESFLLGYLKPRLENILGVEGTRLVYINHDPRGYTLKLNELTSKQIGGHHDWGGYFILAPDFSE